MQLVIARHLEQSPLPHKGIPDDMHHGDMGTYHILCVDLYSCVGEEEGYDGCVAILSRQMQRGLVILQRGRGGDESAIVATKTAYTILDKSKTHFCRYLNVSARSN